jgi:hypothetical protein
MLFVTVWELNENTPVAANVGAAQKLMSAGVFPPEGVTIIRWDATPDGWGILVTEAENVGALELALTAWRAATPGFFKMTRTAPASPVQETVARTAELIQRLGGA